MSVYSKRSPLQIPLKPIKTDAFSATQPFSARSELNTFESFDFLSPISSLSNKKQSQEPSSITKLTLSALHKIPNPTHQTFNEPIKRYPAFYGFTARSE